MPSQDRIYQSLRKVILGFFEGHDIDETARAAYLRQLRQELAPTPKKSTRSRVKIGSASDIERMWAKHEKVQRAREKPAR